MDEERLRTRLRSIDGPAEPDRRLLSRDSMMSSQPNSALPGGRRPTHARRTGPPPRGFPSRRMALGCGSARHGRPGDARGRGLHKFRDNLRSLNLLDWFGRPERSASLFGPDTRLRLQLPARSVASTTTSPRSLRADSAFAPTSSSRPVPTCFAALRRAVGTSRCRVPSCRWVGPSASGRRLPTITGRSISSSGPPRRLELEPFSTRWRGRVCGRGKCRGGMAVGRPPRPRRDRGRGHASDQSDRAFVGRRSGVSG